MSNNSSAESLREKGNEFYKKRDYDHAIDCYSQSIAIQGTAAAYSNRSLCYIQLQNYTKAEADASKAITCDVLFVKAWLRRGICRIARKDIQHAYFDLLRADELNPKNKDIQKQLAICKEDKQIKQISINEHIECLFKSMQQCFDEGNTNEGISYIPDIVEFRPTDITILDRLATLVESKQYWKEASSLYEKLTVLTKQDTTQSLIYLKKRINADYHNNELKAALIGLNYYNSHCQPDQKLISLEKEIKEALSSSSSHVANAMTILEKSMEIPSNPSSLGSFLSSLQALKHTPSLLLRYLQSIPLSLYEELFKKAGSDCDPYETVIDCFHSILINNVSHCFWIMDVLKCMKCNSSFSFVKSLLSSTTLSYLKEMKQQILDTKKVQEESLSIFDDYLK